MSKIIPLYKLILMKIQNLLNPAYIIDYFDVFIEIINIFLSSFHQSRLHEFINKIKSNQKQNKSKLCYKFHNE